MMAKAAPIVEAAPDGGPGTKEDTGDVFQKPDDGSIRWHFKHRWGPWGAPYSETGGVFGHIVGTLRGPWWQQRECVVCNIAQMRRVELPEDR